METKDILQAADTVFIKSLKVNDMVNQHIEQ
jgi:hypothetical protein